MKNMRAVDVDIYVFNFFAADISAGTRTFLHHEAALASARSLMRKHSPEKAGSNYDIIVMPHGSQVVPG
jgi:hypothetical protein